MNEMDKVLENVSGGADYSTDYATNNNGAQYYRIVPGDTLGGIARKFGTSVDQLMRLNPSIKNANMIYAGNTIRVR